MQVKTSLCGEASRIQRERCPDCGESAWRQSGSCWSKCTEAWEGPLWSALYCPAEKHQQEQMLRCAPEELRSNYKALTLLKEEWNWIMTVKFSLAKTGVPNSGPHTAILHVLLDYLLKQTWISDWITSSSSSKTCSSAIHSNKVSWNRETSKTWRIELLKDQDWTPLG